MNAGADWHGLIEQISDDNAFNVNWPRLDRSSRIIRWAVLQGPCVGFDELL
jgi:hypothetical protein